MSYKFSKHEYDLLKKLSGMFYDEYDDRIRLGWDHVIRELPNGVKDEFSDGVFIQKVSNASQDITINFNVGLEYSSTVGAYYRFYLEQFLTNNLLVKGDTANSGIGVCDDGNFSVFSLQAITGRQMAFISSNKRLYIGIESAKIDLMDGVDLVAKAKAYLTLHPVTLVYQLVAPVDIPLPENMDPNTLEIVRLSEKLDQLTASFIAGGGTMI